MRIVLTTGLLCGTCQSPMHPHIVPGKKTTLECTNPNCTECGMQVLAPEIEPVVEPEILEQK